MVLQQKVRVRVSVVPNIFMISLAFVRISNPMVPMAQWVGQQGSEPVGPFSSRCRTNYFHDFTDICKKFHSNGYHGTVDRTTRFWSGRYGFESQPSPTFLIITTENLDTPSLLPPLIHKLFAPGNLLKHSTQGFPYEIFLYCETKVFLEKIVIFPS